MKIVELRAENVKRLKAVAIKPDGSLVVIGGNNRQGKTSTLDAIWMALGGKSAVPDEPVRRGATKGIIDLDLGDLKVVRKFTKKGTTSLTVTDANGAKQSSPQKLLDKLTGSLAFDPLDFTRMEPAKQAAILQDLVGLDLSDLDDKRKEAYDERTAVNRDLKRLEGALASAPVHDDAPDGVVSVAELTGEMQLAAEKNTANAAKREKLERARAEAKNEMDTIGKIEEELEAAKNRIAAANARLEKMRADGKALAAEVAELKDVDTENLRSQIEAAEDTNRKVRENAEAKKLSDELAGRQVQADDLTQRIEQIDSTRADAIARANYPVEGLGVDDAGVTYNGLPFDQASGAEQLQVSVAIGLAANPDLKVLLIRDGSLLDEQSLAAVAAQAEAAGSQVWMERVSHGDECSVIIEDGLVKDAS